MPLPNVFGPVGILEPSAASEVLHPGLYNALKKRFGRVKISKQGQSATYYVETNERGYQTLVCSRQKSSDHDWGETYRICCPYCGDTRFRLSIGHLWGGAKNLPTNEKHLYMARCYNNGCLRDLGMQQALHSEVFSGCPLDDKDTVLKGTLVVNYGPVVEPGRTIPIDQMRKDHPAYLYILKRGYDPKLLAEEFQVKYLIDVDNPKDMGHYRSRIFIPILKDNEMLGYQCRYVGEPPYKAIPKYLMSSPCPRNKLLYNYDVARLFPYTVVLEGATKVWRYGPEAVGTFGKEVSLEQYKMLAENWKKIAIVLDPNALEHAEKLHAYLKAQHLDSALIRLPDGVEPDNMTTPDLRRFVYEEAAKVGVLLE